jgi:hypothetical protein
MLVDEYHISLILVAMAFFISRAAYDRIVTMSRQVITS